MAGLSAIIAKIARSKLARHIATAALMVLLRTLAPDRRNGRRRPVVRRSRRSR